jgi:glycosyltransferase involved in cell wall biosynthesis
MPEANFREELIVFFLASWYPNRLDPLNGIFIKRHAESVSKYCKVAVICAVPDRKLKTKTYDLDCSRNASLLTVRVYYKPTLEHIKIPGVNLFRYVRASYLGFRQARKLIGNPDILHVNVGYPSGILAFVLRKLIGYKYVITEHSSAYTREDGRYIGSPLYVRLATRCIYKNAEAVIAPSKYLLNALKTSDLVANHGVVIPNVVDIPKRIHPKPRYTGPAKVLTVSSLTDRDKNLASLIRSFAAVSSPVSEMELHIIGDGPDRTQLENLAVRLGQLNKGIFFHGLVSPEKLRSFYEEAPFFVINSNYETFSVATAEALAYGVPVIISRCGGPEEYVSRNEGVVIEKRNDRQLVQALSFMCENWRRYERRSIHEYAKRQFNPKRVGNALFEVYNRVLNNPHSQD